MPYADPEKKRQYMKEYNKKWYADNRETRNLVGKAVDNKRNLRLEKKKWLSFMGTLYVQMTGNTKGLENFQDLG